MIIFDLDGCLADCEHRRHFVDPRKAGATQFISDEGVVSWGFGYDENRIFKKFIPNWKSFYEACDNDIIILPVAFQFYALREKFGICHPIQIWSGRCESVRGKTTDWLQKHFTRDINWVDNLKMRPIGDNTPDDQLKERWLDEYLNSPLWPPLDPPKELNEGKIIYRKDAIQFVFCSDPKSITMYRRRGIFVFNCRQHDDEEF